MTPTPSHVATDELIETLERLEKEATPGPWEWEGRTVSDGHVFIPECSSLGDTCIQLTHDYEGYAHDCDLLAFLRNHLPALISALKENKRMRDALEDERRGAETIDADCADASDRLARLAALVSDLAVGTPYGHKVKAYGRFCLGQGPDPLLEVLPHEQEGSESYRAALQPQGEK